MYIYISPFINYFTRATFALSQSFHNLPNLLSPTDLQWNLTSGHHKRKMGCWEYGSVAGMHASYVWNHGLNYQPTPPGNIKNRLKFKTTSGTLLWQNIKSCGGPPFNVTCVLFSAIAKSEGHTSSLPRLGHPSRVIQEAEDFLFCFEVFNSQEEGQPTWATTRRVLVIVFTVRPTGLGDTSTFFRVPKYISCRLKQ